MSKVSEIKEKLVAINRITKVVKGGRRFGFAALVVAGNQKGQVGFGQGKAKQVPDAIKKASESAKRSLIKIPLRDGRTLHHDVKGKSGAGKVVLRSAPAGTGGSANPYNLIRAVFVALGSQQTPKDISLIRGKKIKDIVSRR